jgi:hypothetical protein
LIPKALLHNLGKAVREVLCMPSAKKHAVETAARDQILTLFNNQQEAVQLSRLLQRLSEDDSDQSNRVL